MDIITSMLYVFIGLLIGGLLVLIVDTRFLGQRLKAALDGKRDAEKELAELLKKRDGAVGASERIDVPAELFEPAPEETESIDGGVDYRPEMDADSSAMRDNLTRVSNHVEVLQADKQVLQIEMAAVNAKAQTLEEQLNRVRADSRALQKKNDDLSRQLGAAEAEIGFLRRDVADLQQAPWAHNDLADRFERDLPAGHTEETEPEELPLVDELFLPDEEPVTFVPTDDDVDSRTGVPMERSQLDPLESIDDLFLPEESSDSEMLMDVPWEQEDAEIEHAQPQIESAEPPSGMDSEVQEVRGIGPVFASRLNAAGILSMADLAAQSPEQLSDIVGLNPSQISKPISWIEQAQALSGVFSVEGSPSAADDPPQSTDL